MMRLALCVCLVAAAPALTLANVTFFTSSVDFDDYVSNNALTLSVGPEDFEENSMGTGEVQTLDDPLTLGVANGVFPSGLNYALTIQSNTLGGSASTVSPRGTNGIVAIATGAGFDEVSDLALSNFTADSTDIILGSAAYAISFDTISLLGNNAQVQVYDAADTLLGGASVAALSEGVYAGITSDVPFTRINIWAPNTKSEGADNISVFVPEPGSLVLLALAGALLRRR